MNNRALDRIRDAAEAFAAGVREGEIRGLARLRDWIGATTTVTRIVGWIDDTLLAARAADTEKPEASSSDASQDALHASGEAFSSPASTEREALVERAEKFLGSRRELPLHEEALSCHVEQLADFAEIILRERAPEANGPGIAQAPPEANPCAFCRNENLCVEIHDDDHPGMRGFAVRCGSYLCGARGPVRLGQMDAVEAWNGLRERAPDAEDDPCKQALDDLWKHVILAHKPNYGDWEYPGQAYRHLAAEFDELRAKATSPSDAAELAAARVLERAARIVHEKLGLVETASVMNLYAGQLRLRAAEAMETKP